jgi:hypothetical protein
MARYFYPTGIRKYCGSAVLGMCLSLLFSHAPGGRGNIRIRVLDNSHFLLKEASTGTQLINL